MAEYFAMGGYGLYVWSAYGLAAVLLTLQAALPVFRHRRIVRDIARLSERNRKLQKAQNESTT
ncbi:MAG: heme exporter protein CcmD [Pseudomonadota bacterium]|nr:heme exporter protein CcmD [Pseudomonadota bacterium]